MNRILLLCACALIFFGCGSKNNNPTPSNKPNYKALIIGKWGNEKDTIREYTNDKLMRTVPVTPNGYITFFNDGTASFKGGDPPVRPLTYMINDNILTTNFPAYNNGIYHYTAVSYQEEIREITSSTLYTHYVNRETDDKGNVYLEVQESHYTKLSN
jgi:hypothetical protein